MHSTVRNYIFYEISTYKSLQRWKRSFSKDFCNDFIAIGKPNNRNVHTYSVPLSLRYGHLRRLLFFEIRLVSFFFFFTFLSTLILASKSLKDYHFLLQLQQSESRVIFVTLMSFPCSMANTTVRETHENDNSLKNPSCAGDFPRQICHQNGSRSQLTFTVDLPTSRAQGFFVFRKREKPQKIERGARTSGSTRAHHRNRK